MAQPTPQNPRAPVESAIGKFNLLRWFAVFSLLCIASVSVGAGIFLSRVLERQMLERDAVVSQQFINSLVRSEQAWSYFGPALDSDSVERSQTIIPFFSQLARVPGVARANVRLADGTVLWSNSEELIGQVFGDDPGLEEALTGRIVIGSGTVGAGDRQEHVNFDDSDYGKRFFESYLPIYGADQATVVAVAELYKLPGALFQSIDNAIRLVWLSTTASAVLTYATLFWIVRRASRVVQEHEVRVVESETFAAIGEMASAVAHSVRNPLAAIRSSAEVARLEDDREAAEECLDDVIRQVDRVDLWVRDLLAFFREGDPTSAGAEGVDLAEIIHSTLGGFATALERHGISVSQDVDGLPPVLAQPGPLGQAVTTIVSNAIEALPEGGTLAISGIRTEGGRRVEVRFADNGVGLPKALAKRIFRPFFTTKPNGTGLGLALTRRIVRRYGGEVEFESSEGKGTVVTMTLPAAVNPAGRVGVNPPPSRTPQEV